MSAPAGVVFDVDGTLVDSEQQGHRVAFNQAFEEAGLRYHWDPPVYRALLRVAGGRERIQHFLLADGVGAQEAAALAAELHGEKTRLFRELVLAGGVPLRTGVRRLVDELLAAGVPLYVATTGSRPWVEPLLRRHFGDDTFELILTGTEVPDLKPSPAVYLAVLEQTGRPARELVAVEDSSNGLRAAHGAGIATLVVLNDESDGDFSAAELVVSGFGPGADYVSGPAGPGALVGGLVRPGTLAAVVRARAASS